MRFLCLLLPFLVGCGRVEASTTDMPTLTVEMQADSARVIATWRRPCDSRGCADSYRVQWNVRDAARLRNTSALADTLWVPRPAIGDTLVATVAVTSLRRGITSATRIATAVVRNPDAPPPAVDSLRTDTLTSLAQLAFEDSFPAVVIRDQFGRRTGYVVEGIRWQLCALARNRYTGEAVLLVDPSYDESTMTGLVNRCEGARVSFQAERDG